MPLLTVKLDGTEYSFRPRETIRGEVDWSLDSAPSAVEIRLCWHTSGLVVPEARLVDVIRFRNPEKDSRRRFEFRLPGHPYSFFGFASQLDWAVEVVAFPGHANARTGFTMSPNGEPLDLMAG